MSERSRPSFSGPFATDEVARLEAAIDARLAEEPADPPARRSDAGAAALPPAPTFDEAELEAASMMARLPAPSFDARRGSLVLRPIKRVINLLGSPLHLPQRRFNAAVVERLVAVEHHLRDALAFVRVLRDELSLERAALDALVRETGELRERVERVEAALAESLPRGRP